VLTLIFAWSLLKPLPEVMVWAFLGGFLLDIFSGTHFGLFTASLMITAALANFWHPKQITKTLLPILLIFPYTLLFNLIILIDLQLSGYTIAWKNAMMGLVFPEGIINVAAMAVIFPLTLWFNRTGQQNDLRI